MDNLTGKVIKGYELKEQLGAGGFGAVYRAFQASVRREVAIKVILPQYANHPDFIRRFEAEAQIIARLEHLHIVPLFDYWREPDSAFLVMRLLRGGSLRSSLKQQGAWKTEATSRLLDQIAGALTVAHRHGVVHRDLKPDNILLDDEQNAYLADFGIAKDLENMTGMGDFDEADGVVGSPSYLSPEQIKQEPVTALCDIYSLGIVLYEILTGYPPFHGLPASTLLMKHLSDPLPHLHDLRPDLPYDLHEIIEKATAKEPEQRYPNALALAAAFRRALQDADTEADETLTLIGVPGFTGDFATTMGTQQLDLAWEPVNPYKGLRAFQEADAADFFGRGVLTSLLLERLKPQSDNERFLAVVGPSGSGKSSVVKAGLLPAVRLGELPGSHNWFITEMIPGTHPLEELEAALLRVAATAPDSLISQLREDERGLARAVKRVLPAEPGSELLLVIDQFEEVFTMVEDEAARAHFLNSLLAVANDPRSRTRIVVTLRADFYDRPLLYPDFGGLMRRSTEVVLPLSDQELQQAITGPAERVGLRLEAGLAAAIVADIGAQPGTLPLLQYALSELYERRDGQTLTLDAYRSSGGVLGALSRRAEELYESLSAAEQGAARQLFLRLVTVGEGADDTRRRIRQAEVLLDAAGDDPARKVIDVFGQYRLLTFDRDPVTRGPTVEVAHEALIRQWARLKGWIDDSREDLILQRRLSTAAEEWVNAGRDPGFLASGSRLEQFETWEAGTDLILNEQERAYLQASIAERARQDALEVARQEKEARLEERSRRFLRALVAVMALALVGALGLMSVAITQGNIAQENAATATFAQGEAVLQADNAATAAAVAEMNAEEARSLALVSSAQLALSNNNTDLAIALALAATDIDRPTLEAQRTLAEAAYAPGTRRLFQGHTDWVVSAAFSPDNRTALSASQDNTLILWDIATGEALRRFTGHEDWVWDAAFSPDGTLAASASQDGTLMIWSVASGEALHRLEGHTGVVRSVAFSPDGQQLLSGSVDKTLILWDVATGEMIQQLGVDGGGHSGAVYSVAFSKGGFTALSGSEDGTIILWNVASGQPLLRFGGDEGHTGGVYAVAYTPDELGFISAADDATLILWSFETGAPVRRFVGHSARVRQVVFTPDGRHVLSCAEDNTVILWDVALGAVVRRFAGQFGPIYGLDVSADGRRFLTGGWDTNVRLWDIASGAELHRFDGHTAPVYWVDYSPDGKQALSAGEDGFVILWDVATGGEIRRMEGHEGRVNTVAFSPDGKTALSGGDDLTMILWDLETGAVIRRYGAAGDGHTNAVWAVKFSPDGALALSGSKDNTVILWDVATGQPVQRFIGHRWWVSDVAFLPDGRRILSSSFDFTIKLWDRVTGEEVRTYEGHTDWVRSIDLNADGSQMISASADGTLALWNVETGERLRAYEGHGTQVQSVAFSPDGQYAISGSNDTTLILWDVTSGEILRRFSGHEGVIRNVAFSPDGQTVLSGSGDDSVRLWQVNLSLADLKTWTRENRYVRDFTCAERERFAIEPLCAGPTPVFDPGQTSA